MRRLCTLLCLLPLACAAPDPVVWRNATVQVEVTETRRLDDRFAEYRVEVRGDGKRYCYGSGSLGSPSQRRRGFASVIEADGYIFVPASCGGGNASKCQGYQAFSTKAGLTWLGHITGRWNGDKAVVYEDGVFYDTGDMLEINDLLNHAQSPRYAMAYTEKGKALRFDPLRTWTLNAERYATAQDDAPGLLFKAGLAKLCDKATELKAVHAAAEKVLNQKGRQLFKSSLGQVKTRNLQPSAFIPVGPCPPAEKP